MARTTGRKTAGTTGPKAARTTVRTTAARTAAPAFAPGDVVAFPLANGALGLICIVEAHDQPRSWSFFVVDRFLKSLRASGDVGRLDPMPLPHGQSKLFPDEENVWKGWFQGRIPKDLVVVTRVRLTAKQRSYAEASGTMVFQNAEHFRRELYSQWRWLHDRKALQAEWAAQTAQYEEEQREREAKRKATNSLPTMLAEKPFAHWREHWGLRPVRAVQAAFRTATQELIDLGAKPTKRGKERVFVRLVAELNAIDDKLGCIETGEREDLVARIEELGALVGLDNKDERLSGTRDW